MTEAQEIVRNANALKKAGRITNNTVRMMLIAKGQK